jgi:hypothetical protein
VPEEGEATPKTTTGPRRKSEAKDNAPAPAPAPAAAKTETPAPARAPAAADQKQGDLPMGGDPRITDGQVNYLKQKIKQVGIEESTVLTRFQVRELGEMTTAQFEEIKVELIAAS